MLLLFWFCFFIQKNSLSLRLLNTVSVNNSSKFVENFASHVTNGELVFTDVVFVEGRRLVKMRIHCKIIIVFQMLHYLVWVVRVFTFNNGHEIIMKPYLTISNSKNSFEWKNKTKTATALIKLFSAKAMLECFSTY